MAIDPHVAARADRAAGSADGPPWPAVDTAPRAGDTQHLRTTGVNAASDEAVGGTGETAPRNSGGRAGRVFSRVLAGVRPPDIWGDRPGLARLAAYAHHGEGAPADGPLRAAEIWWWRVVCLPVTACAYWTAWALERPLRGTPVLIVRGVWWLLNIATLLRIGL